MDYVLHWGIVWPALPDMLWAAGMSLQIVVLSVIIGTAIAILLSLAGLSGNRWLGALNKAWVELARNTPTLFQVYFAFFGLGAFHINISPYAAILGAISFNNAGYLSETFRGGFTSLSRYQKFSGLSLGMPPFDVYRYIIIPQVFKTVYYPWTNQVMWALLNSSLGIFVGLNELTGETSNLQSLSFRTIEFFTVAAILYYAMAKLIMISSRLIGWRLFRE
ncbi:Polar amino acid transport system permease protein OS=Castellaniella defragrans OX=75697 GN=HNR28_001210 PE=3 SV=1 [Castellaniella defragrans]